MSIAFERNRSNWEIRVALHELFRVHMMLVGLNRNPNKRNVVWLTKVNPTTRAWILSDRMITTWITSDAHPADPEFALPIPDSFISCLIDLSHDDNGVDIFCNDEDGTIIGRCGSRYAVVDHPEDVTFTQANLPYRALPHGTHNNATMATVDASDMQLFADLVLNWHPRQEVQGNVYPFVSVEIGNSQFAWTMDWRRHGMFRTTGGVPAETSGTITTQFYPYPVAKLLKAHDIEDGVKIYAGAEDADYVYFAGDNWGIRVVNDSELNARWYYKLAVALSEQDADVELTDSERMSDYLPFDIQGHQCFASLHVSPDGLTEFGRLTYVVARNVEPTIAMFEKLNTMNSAIAGASVVMRDDDVRVVCDFPLTDELDLAKTMAAFLKAIEQIGQAYEILPLFSGAGEGYDF
ncbi:MAG: hypothetical protein WCG15_03170 [Actinomycetes bacterium]